MDYSMIQYTNEGQKVPEGVNVHLEKKDTRIIDSINGEKEVLNFSGVVVEDGKIFVSFPKHYVTNKSDLKSDIRLLFKTVMKHYRDNQNLYLMKSVNLKTNYPFNEFFDIYNYYQKFGIYQEEYVETHRGYNGNIAWKETIKNSSKIVNENGILFLPLRIKTNKQRQVFISECMTYVIDYTLRQFSLFLDLPKIDGKNLHKNLFDDKNHILRQLHELTGKIFKDVNKKLLADLISFFENLPNGGIYYLKHYSFSSVWEAMVKHYLNYHFVTIDSGKLVFTSDTKKRNDFSKETFYPDAANNSLNIQPDYYFVKHKEQFVFDAKYYTRIEGINYKQVAYYFFLENFSDKAPNFEVKKYASTHNALILPGDKEQRIHFQFKPEYNHREISFVIYEYYLNTKQSMESYINEK